MKYYNIIYIYICMEIYTHFREPQNPMHSSLILIYIISIILTTVAGMHCITQFILEIVHYNNSVLGGYNNL